MTSYIREPAQETPVFGEYDVVVLGGGLASAGAQVLFHALGQAAGTAADLALRSDGTAANVPVAELQSRLEAEGAFLGRES